MDNRNTLDLASEIESALCGQNVLNPRCESEDVIAIIAEVLDKARPAPEASPPAQAPATGREDEIPCDRCGRDIQGIPYPTGEKKLCGWCYSSMFRTPLPTQDPAPRREDGPKRVIHNSLCHLYGKATAIAAQIILSNLQDAGYIHKDGGLIADVIKEKGSEGTGPEAPEKAERESEILIGRAKVRIEDGGLVFARLEDGGYQETQLTHGGGVKLARFLLSWYPEAAPASGTEEGQK